MNKKDITAYFSKLGKKGGAKSRRTLTPDQARAMVAARIKKRLSSPRSANTKQKENAK